MGLYILFSIHVYHAIRFMCIIIDDGASDPCPPILRHFAVKIS